MLPQWSPLLPPPLPSSAACVGVLVLLQLRHSPWLLAARSRPGWTQLNSATLASMSRMFLSVSGSPESNLCRLYARVPQKLHSLLYATKWTKMPAAIAVALWRAFASIAGILNSRPLLQLAVAVLVESSWWHEVELQRAPCME